MKMHNPPHPGEVLKGTYFNSTTNGEKKMKFNHKETLNLKVIYVCPIEDYEGNYPIFIQFRDQGLRPNHHIVIATNFIEEAKDFDLTQFHELCIDEKLLSKLNIQSQANDFEKVKLKLVK